MKFVFVIFLLACKVDNIWCFLFQTVPHCAICFLYGQWIWWNFLSFHVQSNFECLMYSDEKKLFWIICAHTRKSGVQPTSKVHDMSQFNKIRLQWKKCWFLLLHMKPATKCVCWLFLAFAQFYSPPSSTLKASNLHNAQNMSAFSFSKVKDLEEKAIFIAEIRQQQFINVLYRSRLCSIQNWIACQSRLLAINQKFIFMNSCWRHCTFAL